MASEKSKEVKARLHPRNRNRERYDLNALISAKPELKDHVKPNKYGDDSVDFSNPAAVKILNQALLDHYYGIKFWEFPDENLCPPIPGRADYLHQIADLLADKNYGTIPKGDAVRCFDVGVGASCIYPIIGVTEYEWKFIGSDIDKKSIASAQKILDSNPTLTGKVELRLQEDRDDVFYGILERDEKIDVTICNPPFHASVEDAQAGTRRKVKSLSGNKITMPPLNFSGLHSELVCEGGESRFIQNMIREGRKFSQNIFWFTTLVSKQSNLKGVYRALNKFGATEVKTIAMGTGNKSSRIVAWTFLNRDERISWQESRWQVKDEAQQEQEQNG